MNVYETSLLVPQVRAPDGGPARGSAHLQGVRARAGPRLVDVWDEDEVGPDEIATEEVVDL